MQTYSKVLLQLHFMLLHSVFDAYKKLVTEDLMNTSRIKPMMLSFVAIMLEI